jgi:hypothetical protein
MERSRAIYGYALLLQFEPKLRLRTGSVAKTRRSGSRRIQNDHQSALQVERYFWLELERIVSHFPRRRAA